MKKKFFISLPYIYPVCPLSIDHTRMFVIADILARYYRSNGYDVVFPVASHYSGNTAHNIASIFTDIYKEFKGIGEDKKKIINLFKNIYGTPEYIIKTFTDPLNILDFYTQEILFELKALNISCDYRNFYTTNNKSFCKFVNQIIFLYKKHNLIIKNKQNKLALNYENKNWKNGACKLLSEIQFIQPFQKRVIEVSMSNIRDDWNMLRENGFGVKYNKRWIIDPMFDSELFSIFDLYARFSKEKIYSSYNTEDIFEQLFQALGSDGKTNNLLVNQILNYLPCSIFICEEHLKNWIIKKIFLESYFLNKKRQTRKYFITGMGLLKGKRMSASKGCAILTKDLIRDHGSMKTRLIILLTGGHPSKMYHFDNSLPSQVDSMFDNFVNYFLYLLTIKNTKTVNKKTKRDISDLDLNNVISRIEGYIKDGYFRQIIIELISIIPKRYKTPDKKMAMKLLNLYKRYLDIFLPGFIQKYYL